ncbi:MAG TPA: VWA domain-containing protein [Vicinamibacteria bacterium]|nr:VWA domain-containing protein [Vicinamibacteria bacterium]
MRPSLVAASFLGASSLFAQPPDPRPKFRVDVDTVSLSVTLLDEKGGLVNGLPADNFKVYEDGVEQTIRYFSQAELPLKMVILLDTSSSMRQKIDMARQAAIRFVHSLKPEDEVQVVEFNDRVLTLAEFTSDFDQVQQAIEATDVGGATSLYNAIYISLKDLERQTKDELDRRSIVVLSDGNDTKSLLGFEDVKQQARRSNVIIYAISLRATESDLEKDKYRNAKYELDMLARESGGMSYAPDKLDDLSGVYEEIATELASQYAIGYVSTNDTHDGKWRRLQVLSSESGTEVRMRSGYYARRAPRRKRP